MNNDVNNAVLICEYDLLFEKTCICNDYSIYFVKNFNKFCKKENKNII